MSKSNEALRRKWIAYWRGRDAAVEAGRTDYPPVPEDLHDLCCGARTRAGTPCKMRGLFRSGRCKLHGGLSTGPKSEAGKAKSAQNAKRGRMGNEPHEGLKKPDVELSPMPRAQSFTPFQEPTAAYAEAALGPGSNSETPKVSPRVRCVDCAHMSAAHTCMLGVDKGLSMGALRECSLFSLSPYG